eukprot:1192220-Prorocentrum_minimum.AAC.7
MTLCGPDLLTASRLHNRPGDPVVTYWHRTVERCGALGGTGMREAPYGIIMILMQSAKGFQVIWHDSRHGDAVRNACTRAVSAHWNRLANAALKGLASHFLALHQNPVITAPDACECDTHVTGLALRQDRRMSAATRGSARTAFGAYHSLAPF